MTKPAFIKLTRNNMGATPIYVQVVHIRGFGHAYGEPEGKKGYFIRVMAEGEDGAVDMAGNCWVVRETPEEIMALIDKAQALVHALDNG